VHDVVIVGGGVIGCGLAWALAREGASVRLLERDGIGRQASATAAGMLAPLAESEADDLPIVGRVSPGLCAASGHYRNGILLAAITAFGLAQQILAGEVAPELVPFDPARVAS
jgi:glycine/D-amino acid oxidase-like deaminating enzyme